VVLVDVDPRENRMREELQVLFCGMTRATVRLEVVATGANPNVGSRLAAARKHFRCGAVVRKSSISIVGGVRRPGAARRTTRGGMPTLPLDYDS
jgi:hypothetical protein